MAAGGALAAAKRAGGWEHVQAAARALGLHLHLLPASDDQQFEAAFRGVAGLPSGGVVIGPDPLQPQ